MRHYGVFALMFCVGACSAAIKPMTPSVPAPIPASTIPTATTAPAAGAPVSAPVGAADPTPVPGPAVGRRRHDPGDQPVRVALMTGQDVARLSATGAWALYDRTGENLLVRSSSGEAWTVEQRDGMLRAMRPSGSPTAMVMGPIVARPTEPGSVLSYNGKRYRGELLVMHTDDGLAVVNRLDVESYLRGVVPLEIGTDRTELEEAAVEAQAIAARSYAYTRLNDAAPYDLTATVMDQVYGGMDAERTVSDEAVAATRGLVLMYNGRAVNAPYHANSGGVTAAASEVWRTNDQPYLVSVSDRIPGTDHFYCEQSPKFRWTREYDGATLRAVVEKYLPKYAHVSGGSIGQIHSVTETGRTSSGRIAGVTFETDRGRFTVRGNDVRFVLRSLGGDILPSTLFTFEAERDGDGNVARLVVRGTGAGHGVGMDQWGAIARARAGQDYRTILRTYYPGTTIGPIT